MGKAVKEWNPSFVTGKRGGLGDAGAFGIEGSDGRNLTCKGNGWLPYLSIIEFVFLSKKKLNLCTYCGPSNGGLSNLQGALH